MCFVPWLKVVVTCCFRRLIVFRLSPCHRLFCVHWIGRSTCCGLQIGLTTACRGCVGYLYNVCRNNICKVCVEMSAFRLVCRYCLYGNPKGAHLYSTLLLPRIEYTSIQYCSYPTGASYNAGIYIGLELSVALRATKTQRQGVGVFYFASMKSRSVWSNDPWWWVHVAIIL